MNEWENRGTSGYAGNYGQGNYGQGMNQGTNQWEGSSASRSGYNAGGSQRYEQGRFAGVGPQGYQRSDERITEEINDQLTWHGDLDATNISVRVEQGVVTLSGAVEDRWAKRAAEDIAEQIRGVQDVNNQIQVRRQNNMGNQGNQSETSQRSNQSSTTQSSAQGNKNSRNAQPATS